MTAAQMAAMRGRDLIQHLDQKLQALALLAGNGGCMIRVESDDVLALKCAREAMVMIAMWGSQTEGKSASFFADRVGEFVKHVRHPVVLEATKWAGAPKSDEVAA